jgi:signal transduction histidine kinase
VNIVRNAFDAMPEGGQLTVTSNEVDGDVEIAFSDTGAGMTRETLDRIWSPLFTTKAKGVGLGLPIAKRLTEAHDGSIRAEAHVGGGATFTVRLPIKPREDTQEKRIAWKSVQ